jgi:hypothetical protein|tara:strand:- start:190 stop:435 length:246 start_codon:yes stop_codon:yes gene_type:complete
MDNYYIFTTSVYDTIDKDKIYSREYDWSKENVVLLATEPLTGFSKEFSNDTDTITYLNSESSWPDFGELRFEEQYIPEIDD